MARKTRAADPNKPEEEQDLVEQDFTIVKVRAVRIGEHPSGVLRHIGDEFEYKLPEGADRLPHWVEDVEGAVDSNKTPAEEAE